MPVFVHAVKVIGNQNSVVSNSLQNTFFMFHKRTQVILVWNNNDYWCIFFLGELSH